LSAFLEAACEALRGAKSALERARVAGEDTTEAADLVRMRAESVGRMLPHSGRFDHAGYRYFRDRTGQVHQVRLTPRHSERAAARPGRRA
jgi:hypothetical protein